MKTIQKIFGGTMILAMIAMVFVLPADLATSFQADGRSPAGTASNLPQADGPDWVGEAVTPVLTGPARDLPAPVLEPELDREINPRLTLSGEVDPNLRLKGGLDPLLAVQAAAPPASPTGFETPIFNFNGTGYQFLNPPDTVGDVGADHYIQMVNATIVNIYDKTTAALLQSFDLTALGGCATGGGDPIVLYDHLADRWFLSEFGSGSSLCVFISQTPDPQGAYYSYQFNTPSFPDYPKYGVWPDAYYATTNESSPAAYALNRVNMLAGLPATAQRFTAPGLPGFPFEALTPADLDGMAPPAGAPGIFMRHRDTEVHGPAGYPAEDFLELWAFHVDWANPANSTFTQLPNVAVTEFDSDLCGLSSFYAIGMPGVPNCSTSSLDPLREVVMFRLAYRNFGSHQTLVGNFVTDTNGNDLAGVRWFELRNVTGTWDVYQEGTYAPTGDNRWMGAIAMDGAGNIALGYNVSSQTVYPSLRYVGRLSSDPLGTMPQGEYVLVNGAAANGSNRYGDYAAMSVDPVDDCTFWFTGEYNLTSQWSTRIGAMRFDACGFPDFTLAATPGNQAICAGTDAVYTVDIGQVSGYTDPVTLSTSGEPVGTTVNFSTNPVIPPGSSTLTIGNTAAAAPGFYNIDVIGVAPTSTHTSTVGLEVFAVPPAAPTLLTPANGAINVPPMPSFSWSPVAATGYTIEIATDPLFANIVATATVAGTNYSGAILNTSITYYWRVTPENTCGAGTTSAVWSFTTQAAPGDCGPGSTPNVLFSDGFEAGIGGWTVSGSGASNWVVTNNASWVHSGTQAVHGSGIGTVSDQRLTSPAVSLPVGQNPVTLKFWNYQELEDRSGGCYDGGILEISTNGGTTFSQVTSGLLTDPYDGPVSTGFSNPLGGLNAWCGDPQPYLNSIVDVSAYAGQTVQFRFRLGTDSSVSRVNGWNIDDVVVQSCEVPTAVELSRLNADAAQAPAPLGVPLTALPAATALALGAAYAAFARRRR